MSDISPELVERMVALVRALRADHLRYGALDIEQDFVARTAAIVAELPEPVDPDLIEARSVCDARFLDTGFSTGDYDNGEYVKTALAAIKRGRELAAKGA